LGDAAIGIIRKGDTGVSEESEHVGLIIAETYRQVPGVTLMAFPATGVTPPGRRSGRQGLEGDVEGVTVPAFEAGGGAGRDMVPASLGGGAGGGPGVEEHPGHERRPPGGVVVFGGFAQMAYQVGIMKNSS
jgi:hypothetical protein